MLPRLWINHKVRRLYVMRFKHRASALLGRRVLSLQGWKSPRRAFRVRCLLFRRVLFFPQGRGGIATKFDIRHGASCFIRKAYNFFYFRAILQLRAVMP